MDLSKIKELVLPNGKKIVQLQYYNKIIWEYIKKLIVTGYPLICDNSIEKETIDTKLYGNSVQDGDPTPDTPIEIQSVGDKTKNLFDENMLNGKTAGGVTCTKNADGTYTFSGTATASYQLFYSSNTFFNGLDGETFVLSDTYHTTSTTSNIYAQVEQTNISTSKKSYYSSFNKSTFTVDLTNNTYRFYIAIGTTDTFNANQPYTLNFMLEEGSTASEYEPYGYKLPVVCSGKNLADVTVLSDTYPNYITTDVKTGYVQVLKSAGSLYSTGVPVDWKAGTVISYTPDTTLTGCINGRIRLIQSDGTVFNYFVTDANGEVLSAQKVTLGKDVVTLCFDWSSFKSFGFSNFMVSTDGSDFVPYVSPVTTNIYLNEPLRKIGTYADTISVDDKVATVTRNVGSVETEDLSWTTTTYGYSTSLKNKILNNSILLAECYKYTTNFRSTTNGIGADMFYIGVNTTTTPTGNILYQKLTPTTETYTLSNAISTFDKYTKITVDTEIEPSNGSCEYYGK